MTTPFASADLFKSYCGITATTDDTLIGLLLVRATETIQQYCRRDLTSTSYREQVNGDGTNIIMLKQYPIIAVELLALSKTSGLAVKNTSTDAYRATVKVTDTTFVLKVYGGTNAGTSTLTLASYATMTLLKTAIEALAKGWSVELYTEYTVWSPTELLPIMEKDCLDTYAYACLPEEGEDDYEVRDGQGIIYAQSEIGAGVNNIIVKYTAGYATIPAGVEQACIEFAKYMYDQRKITSGMQSERIGDYSYTIPMFTIEYMQPFARIISYLAPYVKL